MENRDKILDLLFLEINGKILNTNTNEFVFSFDLNKYKNYFLKEEIEEYNKKIDIIGYLDWNQNKLKTIKENIEVISYFLKDIKNYFEFLKNKRKKYIYKIINENLESLKNFDKFLSFVRKSEYYFSNMSHYFSDKEILKYEELWFELETENAIMLDLENLKEYWDRNYQTIYFKVIELNNFLITL